MIYRISVVERNRTHKKKLRTEQIKLIDKARLFEQQKLGLEYVLFEYSKCDCFRNIEINSPFLCVWGEHNPLA